MRSTVKYLERDWKCYKLFYMQFKSHDAASLHLTLLWRNYLCEFVAFSTIRRDIFITFWNIISMNFWFGWFFFILLRTGKQHKTKWMGGMYTPCIHVVVVPCSLRSAFSLSLLGGIIHPVIYLANAQARIEYVQTLFMLKHRHLSCGLFDVWGSTVLILVHVCAESQTGPREESDHAIRPPAVQLPFREHGPGPTQWLQLPGPARERQLWQGERK